MLGAIAIRALMACRPSHRRVGSHEAGRHLVDVRPKPASRLLRSRGTVFGRIWLVIDNDGNHDRRVHVIANRISQS